MDDIFASEDLFDVFEATTPTVSRKSRKSEKNGESKLESPDSPDVEDVDKSPKSSSTKQKKRKLKKEELDESEENKGNSKTERKSSVDGIARRPSGDTKIDKNDVQDTEISPPASPTPSSSRKRKPDKIKSEKMETEKETDDVNDEEDDEDNDGDHFKKPKLINDMEALQRYLPKVSVKTLETPEGSGCTHVAAIPNNTIYIPLHPIVDPVKSYSFTLDAFQNLAVTCVDNYQSVLVSAHTSAGKTVVAEYAIAKGLKDNQRVIYTTPIKALSNQKYREFYEEFKDVGLITGDVTINPSAGCLIMTTEILRNMLYRGSEIMREVGWVVFDEIHYMRDKERGVVWEETIILLPQKTHYVFLSATIPNAVQFAEWIAHLHKQPCNVIHTDYRPVPLHHYIYPEGGDGIHLVVDEQGTFREDGFATAMSMIQNTEGGGGGGNKRGGKKIKGEDSGCHKVVKMAMEHDLAPVIIFSFSKKDCEIYAMQMSKLDFNSAEDKVLVDEVFANAIDVLSKDDQKLPQVENLLPLLKRGIGIHHGGLLPLLKETIEILFSEGLIKCLFATETFAMGLNMPARTVLFTNVRKYDGKTYRWITSGEYIQMSGRAGRRGIDDKGVSIVMIDENISANVGRSLFKGAADAINSEFHLTYNMVLNLMRVEEINPEFMMERSFFQFQNYSSIPSICKKMMTAENEYSSIEIDREEEIASYYNLRKQTAIFAQDFRSFITRPKYIIPFLQPGRMIYVKSGENDFGWGTVVNFKKQDCKPGENPLTAQPIYTVEVLLHLASDSPDQVAGSRDLKPCPKGDKGEMKVVPVTLGVIEKLSQVRLYFSSDLRPKENRMAVLKSIEEVRKRFKGEGIPLLDPVVDMRIKEKEFDSIIENMKKYQDRLLGHSLADDPETPRLYDQYAMKMKYHEAVVEAKAELKKAKSLLQMDELKCRKRVLRRLGYSSGDDVIEIKGRVACELTSGDELLLTEMLFHGIFIDLDTAKCVALLSCLVCDERSQEVPKLSEEMSGALKLMQDIARQIVKVSKESKLELDEDTYVDQFRPFLMDVVHEWCNGASFSKICEMTDIFEGGIIRCMRRLEELLRQMAQAAKVIGNKELEEKFGDGVKLIKRDIVFAASLYL